MKRSRIPLVLLACGLALIGCAKKKPAPAAAPPPPALDPYARMSELRRKAAELKAIAQELPGDRQRVADAFARASEALELLGGPEPTGAFRQQLRIIDNARTVLVGSAEVSAVPVTDSGLRAVQNALAGVNDRLFPGDEKVNAAMGELRTHVSELDTVRGALHGAVAAQAFQSAAAAIDAMAVELDARGVALPAVAAQPPAP